MSRSPSVTAAAAADSQVRGGSTSLFHIYWVSSLAICCYLCCLAVIYQDNHDTGGRVAEGCGSLRLGRAAAAATNHTASSSSSSSSQLFCASCCSAGDSSTNLCTRCENTNSYVNIDNSSPRARHNFSDPSIPWANRPSAAKYNSIASNSGANNTTHHPLTLFVLSVTTLILSAADI
jgi:hypothetical protein